MIGLVDCNNFYASCERVFNPKLKHRPVVVLSNNDGCVIARSAESKEIGISMGVPFFEVKNIIKKNNVAVFSSNLSLYGDLSNRVMNTLKTEVDRLEVYSIDEAFVSFSNSALFERAINIKNKISKWTGIPVSIGISINKTLAKIASHIAKKRLSPGVYVLNKDKEIINVLKTIAVEELWGVGLINANKLKQLGIFTALDLRMCDIQIIRKFFTINELKLKKELCGEVCFQLKTKSKKKKSIRSSSSFENDVKKISELRKVISSHANICSKKLRIQQSCCYKIGVYLKTNTHNKLRENYHPVIVRELDVATNDSLEIVKLALQSLNKIYDKRFSYKKSGVFVNELICEKYIQQSLFDTLNRIKRKKVNSFIDNINARLGRGKVRFAVEGKKMFKRRHMSQRYTTRFSELLEVVI